jgi:polysaccharide biosynthesis/export protein
MTNPIPIALNNASRALARWLTVRSVIHVPSQVLNRIAQPIMNIHWSAWKWSIGLVLCHFAMLVQHANAQNLSDEKSNSPAQFSLSPNASTSERQTGSSSLGQPIWFDSGVTLQPCNCGGSAGCLSCGGIGRIPTAVPMCPPQQPTGVTSGACKPCITGIDCAQGPNGEKRWSDAQGIDFGPLWHGEYIGPIRLPSLLEYRVRINDEVLVTYIPNRQVVLDEYKLTPGDELNINSVSDKTINRDRVQIQPDGTIVVPLIVDTRIMAAGKSIGQLRRDLEVAFKKYISNPAINVEPVKVNTAVEDLKDAVNGPFAAGGRVLTTVVNPDGRIQLVGIGSVYVLGMTLEEIKRELNLRYRSKFVGIEVEPRLSRTAPHYLFVFGEVASQGRFEMSGPTTVTQGLALAGGLKLGANNRQVVIFRRAEDWRLVSTMLDLRGGQLGKRPNPSDEIWLRDNDLIIVPPTPIKSFGNTVQQVFTDGLYRIVPFQVISLQKNSF